jgi:hypothetical protein
MSTKEPLFLITAATGKTGLPKHGLLNALRQGAV